MTDNKRQWLEAGTVPIDNWTHVVAVKFELGGQWHPDLLSKRTCWQQ